MAGSLIKIDEEIVSSAVASVTLTGIDTTYDVYMVTGVNIESSTGAYIQGRFTESGTPNSTTNYDGAFKLIRSYNTFLDRNATNDNKFEFTRNLQGTGNNNSSFISYIFNANNSSEYTFITNEAVAMTSSTQAEGMAGGNVFTVTSAVDGVYIFFSSGNINSAVFTLYGLKK